MLLLLFPLLFLPFLDSCLLVNPNSKCQCPPIGYIDQSGIANSEYGSYLANRTTTRPKVRVSDECLIMADVSALHTPNHFLMLFRTAAPPIFAKRLSESSDKIINLTDIHCVENNDGQFNWMYYGGVVNDLSVAVQSNEGMCECPDLGVLNRTICDRFELQCAGFDDLVYTTMFSELGRVYAIASNESFVLDDMTCVSGTWYYNSAPVNPSFNCQYWPNLKSRCDCFDIYGLSNSFGYTLAKDGAFADYMRTRGTEKYTGCEVELNCPVNQTLVVFSENVKPIINPPETKISATCGYSPLTTSPSSAKQWYINGVIMTNPTYGCYVKQCPCSFAFLTGDYIQNYVDLSHPFYQNITSFEFMSPSLDSSSGEYCPTQISCFFNEYSLINLDTRSTTSIKTLGYSTAVSCSPTTGKWTINGGEFDRLYAICAASKTP